MNVTFMRGLQDHEIVFVMQGLKIRLDFMGCMCACAHAHKRSLTHIWAHTYYALVPSVISFPFCMRHCNAQLNGMNQREMGADRQ